jgi:hypothetical protein
VIGGAVARHRIDVIRAPLVDDGRGNKERDWANATERGLTGWAIDAGSTTEDEVNRDGSAVEYTIRGPFAADIAASDHVRLLGAVFEITGGILRQPGPSPLTSHTIIRLTRWEG